MKKSVPIVSMLLCISWGCLSYADISTDIRSSADELSTNIVVDVDELKKSLGTINLSANLKVSAAGDKAWSASDSLNQHQTLVEIIKQVDRFHTDVKSQEYSNLSTLYSLEGLLAYKRAFIATVSELDNNDEDYKNGLNRFLVHSAFTHTNDFVKTIVSKIIKQRGGRNNLNVEHGIEIDMIIFNDQNQAAFVQFMSLENGIPAQEFSHLDLVKVNGEWKVPGYYLSEYTGRGSLSDNE